MIGALAIKNRRKKQLGLSDGPPGPPPKSIYFQRCHFLYVIAGCSFIIGLVLLIPGCFGDAPFLIYAGSSLGISVVCFLFACLLTPMSSDDEDDEGGNNNNKLPASSSECPVTPTKDNHLESGLGRRTDESRQSNNSGGSNHSINKPNTSNSTDIPETIVQS